MSTLRTETPLPARVGKLTYDEDLNTAAAQKSAMTKTKLPLLSAIARAVRNNAGFRAVSIYAGHKGDEPTVEVNPVRGSTLNR
jgi:hypothetical protein